MYTNPARADQHIIFAISTFYKTRIMVSDNGKAEDASQHENGSQGSQSPGGGAAPDADEEKAAGGGVSEQLEPFNNIPVFLDRTYRMVENVPDDIVCWSDAGDSFIIKQASKESRTGAEARRPRIRSRRCVFARRSFTKIVEEERMVFRSFVANDQRTRRRAIRAPAAAPFPAAC